MLVMVLLLGKQLIIFIVHVHMLAPVQYSHLSIHLACAEVKDLETKRDAIKIFDESSITNYYKLRQQLRKLGKELQHSITKPLYCVPFLQPGRVVQVMDEERDVDFGWGCVINYQKKTNQKVSVHDMWTDSRLHTVHVLVMEFCFVFLLLLKFGCIHPQNYYYCCLSFI